MFLAWKASNQPALAPTVLAESFWTGQGLYLSNLHIRGPVDSAVRTTADHEGKVNVDLYSTSS